MKMREVLVVATALAALGLAAARGATLEAQVLEPSVMIRAGFGTGSGVVFTRGQSNYILTAAHVVAGLRTVRTRLEDGREAKYEHFEDAQVVKVLTEGARQVGRLEMDARVLAYSDAEEGEDLALLEVRKRGFIATSGVFRASDEPVAVGTRIYHCGSLRGEIGSNSLTDGIVSRVGRVVMGKVYDQSNATAFPGSSGGGVFTESGDYIGMITRGVGEGFNLFVPARRVRAWLRSIDREWMIDPSLPEPSPGDAE